MKMGLSLSVCVADILDGKVNVEDVALIRTNTAARNEGEWNQVMQQYSVSYWWWSPSRARKIVQLLRAAGRIQQPRVDDPSYYHTIKNGVWQEIAA